MNGFLAVVDEQLKDVGSFASLSLALLVVFTTARAQSLEGWAEGDVTVTRGRARWTLALDAALLVASVTVLLALFPLLWDAADELSIGTTRGVLRDLFLIGWFGFLVLAAYQLWICMDRRRRYRKIEWD